jgi:L-amino acid N-acyltransferase YncA
MTDAIRIRPATEADADRLLVLYRPFVEATAISFETVVPTVDEFAERIQKAVTGWQWLVAEKEGRCVGYAYGSSHRERPAYRWSVEVSAYVDRTHHREGIGRSLYSRLLADLMRKGFCNAYAGVTLPNESSVALHRAMGFEPIGTFRAVGHKFGRWHDVAWYQRRLRDSPPADYGRTGQPTTE